VLFLQTRCQIVAGKTSKMMIQFDPTSEPKIYLPATILEILTKPAQL
jgi:hypothetical protein